MLVKRLDHDKPAVQILALKLAETMMKNCDISLQRQVRFHGFSRAPRSRPS